jgi:hypothetical protein
MSFPPGRLAADGLPSLRGKTALFSVKAFVRGYSITESAFCQPGFFVFRAGRFFVF